MAPFFVYMYKAGRGRERHIKKRGSSRPTTFPVRKRLEKKMEAEEED